MTYRLILQQQGYEVSAAYRPKKRGRRCRGMAIDLLLCDLSLEKQENGFDVIDFARQKNPQMPQVLLTGYATPEANDHASGTGHPGFVQADRYQGTAGNDFWSLLKEDYEQHEAAG